MSGTLATWARARTATAEIADVRAQKADVATCQIGDALIAREARAMDALADAMIRLEASGALSELGSLITAALLLEDRA